jgi:acetyl/propionyl-CoA carboxylase alpha subunit
VTTTLRTGGRTLAVAIGADAVTVDGEPRDARIEPVAQPLPAADGHSVEELVVVLDGRTHRAVVARRSDRVLVSIDGVVHTFAVGDDAVAGGAGGVGSGTVTAPMPGKVIRVAVAVGDTVMPGQALVVLEAMKMETTLAAEVAGTVKAVHAAEGAMVDGGALLVEIAAAQEET